MCSICQLTESAVPLHYAYVRGVPALAPLQGISIGIPELERTTVFLFRIPRLFQNSAFAFPLAPNLPVTHQRH
jgi:hypothetical protein